MNFKPKSRHLLTTAHLVQKEKSTILIKDKTPTMKEIQQVVAVGDHCAYEVGDWVLIDMSGFLKEREVRSNIKAGIGGKTFKEQYLDIPFFAVPGDETPFLKLEDFIVEGTILDWNKLPNDVKAFQTMEDFKKEQADMEKEANAAVIKNKREIDANQNKDVPESAGPMVRTDSQRL